MNGYPKTLNSREDYEYVRTNFPKSEWEQDYQDLLNTVYEWYNMGEVEGEGITDETHRVEEEQREDSETVICTQWEYRKNPDAKIFRLGFTEDEVKEILEKIE